MLSETLTLSLLTAALLTIALEVVIALLLARAGVRRLLYPAERADLTRSA